MQRSAEIGQISAWQYYAAKKADEDEKVCKHRPLHVLFEANPLVIYSIELKVRCLTCKVEYPVISDYVYKKYMKIYGMQDMTSS